MFILLSIWTIIFVFYCYISNVSADAFLGVLREFYVELESGDHT